LTPYQTISKINKKKFQGKSVAIIGAGWMGEQYAIALQAMKVKDVSIISNTKEKTLKFCEKYNFKPYYGGYEKNLPKLKKMDLVIITPPIEISIKISKKAIKTGQNNILIEKPASLFFKEIESFKKKVKKQRVRIAYNRVTYPNLIKLKELVKKEGGIISCHFTITERIRDLVFPKKGILDIHKRLGLYNSIHVTSMVMDLIGEPKKMSAIQFGKFPWHPTGAIFVGSGITKKNILFSYHANWLSSGRWGIEVMTRKNAYRLISLEELFVSKIHQDKWTKVPFSKPFPNVKQGVAEEIAIMLNPELEKKIPLVNLKKGNKIFKFTEKIFGYK